MACCPVIISMTSFITNLKYPNYDGLERGNKEKQMRMSKPFCVLLNFKHSKTVIFEINYF